MSYIRKDLGDLPVTYTGYLYPSWSWFGSGPLKIVTIEAKGTVLYDIELL